MRDLPDRPPHRSATLLDIGCGDGAYLKLAQNAGWNVRGIDFDPLAVAAARKLGLDVSQGGIESLEESRGAYDWITCSHVIEHVHHPADMLRQMFGLLRPGGTLWIQTPNLRSYGHKNYGADWRGLEPPRHLVIYTLPELRKQLEQVGFKTVAKTLPAISAMTVFASSETMRAGQGMLSSVTPCTLLKPRYQVPAILQSILVQRSEFITILATRPPP